MLFCVLFQLIPDDKYGWVHWYNCEEGLHIIRCNAFPFPKSDEFDLVYKVLDVPDMMLEISYQWPEDVCQLLGHTIGNCNPVGLYGPKGVSYV